MITVRKAAERGHVEYDWLDTWHTFSFDTYYDPQHMGYHSLRVINDDRVAAGAGFPTHPHRDMEIITYMLEGALAHKDSMGNGSTITRSEVQHMTAGTGVAHSEFNASQTEVAHLLQIWVRPRERGLTPGYSQKLFADETKTGRPLLVVSGDGRDGSLKIQQDVDLYACILEGGSRIDHQILGKQHAWIQMARGSLDVNGVLLAEGDGAAIDHQPSVSIGAVSDCEFLFFDIR
jgi:hypothetical protein